MEGNKQSKKGKVNSVTNPDSHEQRIDRNSIDIKFSGEYLEHQDEVIGVEGCVGNLPKGKASFVGYSISKPLEKNNNNIEVGTFDVREREKLKNRWKRLGDWGWCRRGVESLAAGQERENTSRFILLRRGDNIRKTEEEQTKRDKMNDHKENSASPA